MDNQQPSYFIALLNNKVEGSTTIPKGSTLQAIGSGNVIHRRYSLILRETASSSSENVYKSSVLYRM